MSMTSSQVIQTLSLQPHPEGGYFAETFRDTSNTLPSGRAASTAIYYLLQSGQQSRLHRLDASEAWHFYAAKPTDAERTSSQGALNIVELSSAGPVVTRLGMNLETGERPQYTVKPGVWFGAQLAEGTDWVLVGCTVAPGFEFAKFEMGQRRRLLQEFPSCRELIERLTADGD